MAAFGQEKCILCGEWRFPYELNQSYECFYCLTDNGTLPGWPCPECETDGCKYCNYTGYTNRENLE